MLFSARSGARTRFRLFPQAPFLHPDRPPEIVTIASPAGHDRPRSFRSPAFCHNPNRQTAALRPREGPTRHALPEPPALARSHPAARLPERGGPFRSYPRRCPAVPSGASLRDDPVRAGNLGALLGRSDHMALRAPLPAARSVHLPSPRQRPRRIRLSWKPARTRTTTGRSPTIRSTSTSSPMRSVT